MTDWGRVEADLGTHITQRKRIAGGDINEAWLLDLSDGRRVFLKTHAKGPDGMFPAEKAGLIWLDQAQAIRTPKVLSVWNGEGGHGGYLCLSFVEGGRRGFDFDEVLGQQLAALHRSAPAQFGLATNNFIGRLDQDNTEDTDWARFYWERRIWPQVRLAHQTGRVERGFVEAFDALQKVLSERIGPKEPPARLHGDLWAGNYMSDRDGRPVLIDPAVYGGHREVDLAMMRLFGGFSETVFQSYHEAFPLSPGWELRVPLYQLYPVLVHVNLFGGSYGNQAKALLRQIL
ncbi:MAG: hypothetical protein CMH54_02525 [Myxococcales bacterium]|nr:hypothetical protein [Myxococcales bacterium]